VPGESEAELKARLEKLEADEREISALRRKLHDRLASFPNEVTAEHEREISKQRRELHAEIDELRVKLRELQGR
jgi:chromosome segregation ATPase